MIGRCSGKPTRCWPRSPRRQDRPGGRLLGADAYLAVARAWLGHGDPGRACAVLRPLLAAAQRQRWRPVLAEGGLVAGRCAAALGDSAAARAGLSTVAELGECEAMPLVARAARAALALADPGQGG